VLQALIKADNTNIRIKILFINFLLSAYYISNKETPSA
jgi:hypothetical protein